MKGKIFFAGRSVEHWPYHKSLVLELERRGYFVQVAYQKQWSKKHQTILPRLQDDLRGKNIRIDIYKPKAHKLKSVIFELRELRTYLSYAEREDQSQFYSDRWLSYLNAKARPFYRFLYKKKLFRRLVGLVICWIDQFVRVEKFEWIKPEEYSCIVLQPLNMRFSEEVEILKYFKSKKIKSFLPIYSWDNLTNKGLIHVVPDYVVLWNEFQRENAIQIHKIPNSRLKIIGALYFDRYLNVRSQGKKNLRSSNDILYMCSSGNICKSELQYIDALYASIENINKHLNPKQKFKLFVRPHPANCDEFMKIDLNEKGWYFDRKIGLDYTQSEDLANAQYLNRFFCVIGLNTSGFIDALALGIPVIAYTPSDLEGKQIQTKHFRELLSLNALYQISSPNQLEPTLMKIRNQPFETSYIERFQEKFLGWPADNRSAAHRIADEIESGLTDA